MKKWLFVFFLFLFPLSIFAADEIPSEIGIIDSADTRINPAKEDGNLATINTKLGEVQATPTANTVLARLKAIEDALNSVAVTGTFYQVTQPVSIATMPSTPVTGTFWQVTQPVSIATMPSTPVTGTFYQATQPVSIASMPSTPVTGTFWQTTQPVSLASVPSHAVTNAGTFATQATLQAGTALIGQASTSNETSTIYSGTTALTPKYAIITASSSGNTAVVSAVSGKKIRVIGYYLMANGAVNVKWQSATTDKTGLIYLIANTGISVGYNPVGWFETAASEALNINLSASIAVGGTLVYLEV